METTRFFMSMFMSIVSFLQVRYFSDVISCPFPNSSIQVFIGTFILLHFSIFLYFQLRYRQFGSYSF